MCVCYRERERVGFGLILLEDYEIQLILLVHQIWGFSDLVSKIRLDFEVILILIQLCLV